MLAGAFWFYLSGVETPGLADYADEHPINQQRAITLMCWIHGAVPDLGLEDFIGPERTPRCAEEYTQQSESWCRLLGEHAKPGFNCE